MLNAVEAMGYKFAAIEMLSKLAELDGCSITLPQGSVIFVAYLHV